MPNHNQNTITYYDILGISSDATPAEIKKAYRLLILKVHPDGSLNGKEILNEFSKTLNEAYSVLSNPAERARYDQELQGHQPQSPPLPVITPNHTDLGLLRIDRTAQVVLTIDNQGSSAENLDIELSPEDSWLSIYTDDNISNGNLPGKIYLSIDGNGLLPGKTYRGKASINLDGVVASASIEFEAQAPVYSCASGSSATASAPPPPPSKSSAAKTSHVPPPTIPWWTRLIWWAWKPKFSTTASRNIPPPPSKPSATASYNVSPHCPWWRGDYNNLTLAFNRVGVVAFWLTILTLIIILLFNVRADSSAFNLRWMFWVGMTVIILGIMFLIWGIIDFTRTLSITPHITGGVFIVLGLWMVFLSPFSFSFGWTFWIGLIVVAVGIIFLLIGLSDVLGGLTCDLTILSLGFGVLVLGMFSVFVLPQLITPDITHDSGVQIADMQEAVPAPIGYAEEAAGETLGISRQTASEPGIISVPVEHTEEAAGETLGISRQTTSSSLNTFLIWLFWIGLILLILAAVSSSSELGGIGCFILVVWFVIFIILGAMDSLVDTVSMIFTGEEYYK